MSQFMSQASQSSQLTLFSSAPSSSANKKGICSVCGALQKLVVSSNVLWKHGHGHGRPTCPGSGQPPKASSWAPVHPASSAPQPGGTLMDTDRPPGAVLPPSFNLSRPTMPTLPRIPKGTRRIAASTLLSRLRGVIDAPDDITMWGGLLGFASALMYPEQGATGRNLTTRVIHQMEGKQRSRLPHGQSLTVGPKAPGSRIALSEEDLMVRRATTRLQEGVIRGAARILTSSETLAPFLDDTVAAMKVKRGAAPSNRRPLPLPLGPNLVVTGGILELPSVVSHPGQLRSGKAFALST
jgi:hypothetical protein